MSEKDVSDQEKELRQIEEKANQISQKIRFIKFDLMTVFHDITELEKEYDKYYGVRYSEKQYTQRKSELERVFRQGHDDLLKLSELVSDTFS